MATDVPAVASAVRILERLAADLPHPVSPTQLVKDLGLNRSTCYNILATLQRAGWVSNLGERSGWTLGPRLLSLTGVTRESGLSVLHEEMDALSRRLGYIVFATERSEAGGYTVVAKAEHGSGVRVTVGIGDYFPFSAPAIMQAFEAYTPDEEVIALVRRHGLLPFTPLSVTRVEELLKVLAEVRECGFSRSLRQFDLSQGAAAAPVFDPRGRVSTVLCTVAFDTELNSETIVRVGIALRASADRITHRTGGTLPAVPGRHGEGSLPVAAPSGSVG